MALCVRRLRGAPGLGRRGQAGGAAGRQPVRDAILFRDPRPAPRVAAPFRRPPPSLSACVRPLRPTFCLPAVAWDETSKALRDSVLQPGPPPCAKPPRPHLSAAQLDCFRSLFDAGVCRTPYWAEVPAPKGLLAFTPSKSRGAGKASGGHKPDMEEQLALMYDKLREELPNILRKPLNYPLYRWDMEFISNVLHLRLRGLLKYQLFLLSTRLLLTCCFCDMRVSVLKLTSHPENNTIQARWSFSALPLPAAIVYFFRTEKSGLYRTYDAFSTFQLAPDGRICLHRVERVMPSPPIAVPTKTILAAALLALGLGENRPALNLLSSPKTPHEL